MKKVNFGSSALGVFDAQQGTPQDQRRQTQINQDYVRYRRDTPPRRRPRRPKTPLKKRNEEHFIPFGFYGTAEINPNKAPGTPKNLEHRLKLKELKQDPNRQAKRIQVARPATTFEIRDAPIASLDGIALGTNARVRRSGLPANEASSYFPNVGDFGKIMKPYKKFIVKIRDGIFLKTRFGVQKLKDDKLGLYLKNAYKKKLFLHRWNKTSSFGANQPPPPPSRALFPELNKELTPPSFQLGDLVRFVDPVSGKLAVGGEIFQVVRTQFKESNRTFYHWVKSINVIGLGILPVPRDLLAGVFN